MLIYSMSVSVDGFIADRGGAIGWAVTSEELFRFHTALVSELGGCLLGRRLYETMLAEEIAAALDATDTDVQVGGAGLAAQAIELGLVDELRNRTAVDDLSK